MKLTGFLLALEYMTFDHSMINKCSVPYCRLVGIWHTFLVSKCRGGVHGKPALSLTFAVCTSTAWSNVILQFTPYGTLNWNAEERHTIAIKVCTKFRRAYAGDRKHEFLRQTDERKAISCGETSSISGRIKETKVSSYEELDLEASLRAYYHWEGINANLGGLASDKILVATRLTSGYADVHSGKRVIQLFFWESVG